jgi:hypothetical protein
MLVTPSTEPDVNPSLAMGTSHAAISAIATKVKIARTVPKGIFDSSDTLTVYRYLDYERYAVIACRSRSRESTDFAEDSRLVSNEPQSR